MRWQGVPVASSKHTLRVQPARGDKPLPVSPRLVRSLPHPDRTANVLTLQFTPRGELFSAGYPSGVVQLWDVASGKELRRIETPRGYRGSADYAWIGGDFSTLYVPRDNRKAIKIEGDPKNRYRVEYSGELLVWDAATGKPRPTIRPADGRGVVDGSVSPDGKRLVTVERAGYQSGETVPPDVVRLYDLATGKSRQLGEGYGQAAFSPDGRNILVTFSHHTPQERGELKLFDTEGKERATIGWVKGKRFVWPLFSPDGRHFAAAASRGRINEPATMEVYEAATRKRIAAFPTGGEYPFLVPSFSPDGKLLAAGDYGDNLTVWDVEKREVLRKHHFKGMGPGLRIAFSPDGKRLAVPVRVKTDEDRSRDPDPLDAPQPRVYLFDLTKPGEPEEIVCPHGWAGAVAFSPDGKTLAFGSAGAVHLLDVGRGVP